MHTSSKSVLADTQWMEKFLRTKYTNLATRNLVTAWLVATCLVNTLILAFCHVSLAGRLGRLKSGDDSKCNFQKCK